VWCRSSNPGGADLQDLAVGEDGRRLYEVVAGLTASWNARGNAGLVVGATYPEELARVRAIAADLPILVPGVGAQGGDLRAAVRAARDAKGSGFLVASSRGVLYASPGEDYARAAAEAARSLRDGIRTALAGD
jgi:orotidine-5'-phosphate decarboxylase